MLRRQPPGMDSRPVPQTSFSTRLLTPAANFMNNRPMAPQPIGLFGGTFDPIHYGHLRTAFELWQALGLAEVRFMPTGSPPPRERTHATAEHRVAMVRAAVA